MGQGLACDGRPVPESLRHCTCGHGSGASCCSNRPPSTPRKGRETTPFPTDFEEVEPLRNSDDPIKLASHAAAQICTSTDVSGGGKHGSSQQQVEEQEGWRARALAGGAPPSSLQSKPNWAVEKEEPLLTTALWASADYSGIDQKPTQSRIEQKQCHSGGRPQQGEINQGTAAPAQRKPGNRCLCIGKKRSLTPAARAKVEQVFQKMDIDRNGEVNKREAQQHFKGNFGKLSAAAMFNEVDTDRDDFITLNEFVGFWEQVKRNGYAEAQIIEELDEMMSGAAWVDWKDSRDVDTRASA